MAAAHYWSTEPTPLIYIYLVDADFAWLLLQASGGDKAMQKVAVNLQVMVAELPPLEGTTQPRSLEVWLPKRVNKEWKAE